MIREGKFGTFEAVCLMTIVIASKSFFSTIRLLLKTTGTAGWYSTLVSCLTSIVLFMFLYLLMKRFPGMELTEIFERVTGKIIGKFLSFLFVAYFIYYSGVNIREFVEMIKTYVYPYTPPSVIVSVFLLAVLVITYVGLEGVARLSAMCFIPAIIGFIGILILAYPNYRLDYIFPLGGYGIDKTLYYGILRSSAYSEPVMLAFIINSIHGVGNFKKIGLLSLVLSGVIISISIFCDLMAFSFTVGSENVSSLFQLSRIIYFSRFFQRVESIFIIIWVITAVITVAATFYIAVSIFCKAFRVNNHRPLLFPASFLTFMIALLPENLVQVAELYVLYIRQYSIFFVYLIPILVLIVSLILGKKGGIPENEKA